MGAMATRCGICNELVFEWQHHKCPPSWNVRFEDCEPDEEASKVWAKDAATAAETYVEQWQANAAEYPEKMTVIVERNGCTWKLVVQVEAVPQYTAYDANDWESNRYPLPARYDIPGDMKVQLQHS